MLRDRGWIINIGPLLMTAMHGHPPLDIVPIDAQGYCAIVFGASRCKQVIGSFEACTTRSELRAKYVGAGR